MHQTLKVMPLASALLLAAVLSTGQDALAGAQDESKPARSARGGLLAQSGQHQFEIFFYTTGLRVFPLNSAGTPIDVSHLTGTAMFYHPNSPRPWFSRMLHVAPVTPGQTSRRWTFPSTWKPSRRPARGSRSRSPASPTPRPISPSPSSSQGSRSNPPRRSRHLHRRRPRRALATSMDPATRASAITNTLVPRPHPSRTATPPYPTTERRTPVPGARTIGLRDAIIGGAGSSGSRGSGRGTEPIAGRMQTLAVTLEVGLFCNSLKSLGCKGLHIIIEQDASP